MSFIILIVDQIQTLAVISLSLSHAKISFLDKYYENVSPIRPTDSGETGKEGQSVKVDEQNGDLSVKEEHEEQETADRMRT